MTANISITTQFAALTLGNVSLRYGKVIALNNVSLELKRGEFLTMLGPSGSGKTTLLRVIAGFLRPDSGAVVLHGQDVVDVPPRRRNIGMVFQDYALFPHLTVAGNVGFPLETRGVARAERHRKVSEILNVVGLANFENRFPKQLSGGQQQRVALARALIFDPEIVLLDEPMAALDKKLRASMQLEIMKIAKQLRATVISVTHDQEEALVMSDRIALFNQGELAQVGTPLELYQQPKTEFVADFIGEANILRGRATAGRHGTSITGIGWTALLPDHLKSDRGTDASIIIRPETIRLSVGDNAGLPNQALGILTDKIYLGVEYKLIVELGERQCIHVRSREMKKATKLEVGRPVALTWDTADIVAVWN